MRRERPKLDRKRGHAAEQARPAAGDDRARVEHPHAHPAKARIVVPRQERGGPRRPDLDIELREVRYGTTSRGPYLRVVPSKTPLKKTAEGRIEATLAGSRPRGAIERVLQAVKAVVLGSPIAASQAIHERLTKLKALAILGSDPLSSSAYATEEALIILALAGTAGLAYLLPIGATVAALLVLVTISYRQTIRAYPNGGGAYAVAHANLGAGPGLVAAGALLVDYTLLVSVSTAAGVAAITSAVPDLADYRVPLCVAVVAFFGIGNLRGIRESGTIFAAPTYFFIFMMSLTVVVGFVKVVIGEAPGSFLHAAPPQDPEHLESLATSGLTLWLVLRAFSSGASALTGVEAMANGVPSFKKPESENARQTMVTMAAIAVFLFLGITFLSSRFGLVPETDQTLVSAMGRSILGENVLYFGYQAATAMILFLAANTSFNAFPLLGAILARDRYLPRQFNFRGDKLAFSNGIILLSIIAAILLVVYDASVTKLIPLYAVGVFIAFTLSQLGMVKHWYQLKEPGWRWSLAMNGVGFVATGIVCVIIGATKFTHGAWISLAMVAVMVALFSLIRRHYNWYQRAIAIDEDRLLWGVPQAVPLPVVDDSSFPGGVRVDPGGARDHVVVPVDDLTKITIGAINMGRAVSGNITAVHLTDEPDLAEAFREEWNQFVPDVPLVIIESPYRAFAGPMLYFIDSLEQMESADHRIIVILPGFKAHHWWENALHNQAIRRLRPFLQNRERVRVVDFLYDVPRNGERGNAS